jgi:hypothetical protein
MALIKLDNYRLYLETLMKDNEERIKGIEHRAQLRKAEYEDGFFANLFRWKWENSFEYFHEWDGGYWLKDSNKQIARELEKLDYHKALGDTLIEFNDGKFSSKDFYSFAKKNNLP